MLKKQNRLLFIETLVVLILTLLLFIFFEEYRSYFTAFPVLYLFIERSVRKRTWSSIGFKFKDIGKDVKSVWTWLVIVIFASPILTLFIANIYLPEFVLHVKERLPVDITMIIPTLIIITIGTFLEEIIFRGLFKKDWFIGSVFAIAIASILFALMHYSKGNPSIAYDVITILIDSIIYGIIYLKTKNIFVPWIGYYLCDIVAISII